MVDMLTSRSDLEKPLDRLSKMRAEQISKYRKGQVNEELAAMGQDNERKAAKWVSEFWKNIEKKDLDKKRIDLEVLGRLRQRSDKKEYFRYCVDIMTERLKEEDIPPRYTVTFDLTDQGIIVNLNKRHSKKTRMRAFAPSGIPKFDIYTCHLFCVIVGNTVAKWDGYRHKSEGGIILADKEDDAIYGRSTF